MTALRDDELIEEFEQFLNEPPQYEDRRMVREYRHEAYAKWSKVRDALRDYASRRAQAAPTPILNRPKAPIQDMKIRRRLEKEFNEEVAQEILESVVQRQESDIRHEAAPELNAATAEGTLGSVNQAGSTPAPAVAAPLGDAARNLAWPDEHPNTERDAALKRAVESQRNDTRTDEQKVADGVTFIMGDAAGAARDAQLEALTRPVIKWLNENFHPHVTVVIDPTSAVLSEGMLAYTTHDYVRD